jgi:hypothetical protein
MTKEPAQASHSRPRVFQIFPCIFPCPRESQPSDQQNRDCVHHQLFQRPGFRHIPISTEIFRPCARGYAGSPSPQARAFHHRTQTRFHRQHGPAMPLGKMSLGDPPVMPASKLSQEVWRQLEGLIREAGMPRTIRPALVIALVIRVGIGLRRAGHGGGNRGGVLGPG